MDHPPKATAAVPLVTVIIQTYNRSNILGYVIDSVLAQTRPDWELLVIGDGCTDDTADVVAAFDDPRIRFSNLETRVGDQSGPTNEGIRIARGRYIALLNHDDFWFPDHLWRSVDVLEKSGADLVFTLQLEADPDGRWRVNAVFPEGRFDPLTHPNASTWVFRRELAHRVGALQRRDKVWTFPTREWLWRAHRMGARTAAVEAVTVIVISSTTRRNVYSERQWHEHAKVHAAMTGDPEFREKCLCEAWTHAKPSHLRSYSVGWLLRAAILRIQGRLFQLLGGDPMSLYCYYRFPRKWGFIPKRGALIAELYRRRGLPKEDAQ
jgi:glycosyltransferase involved in cell wall biosynthesis